MASQFGSDASLRESRRPQTNIEKLFGVEEQKSPLQRLVGVVCLVNRSDEGCDVKTASDGPIRNKRCNRFSLQVSKLNIVWLVILYLLTECGGIRGYCVCKGIRGFHPILRKGLRFRGRRQGVPLPMALRL
jgi:hypothetical protein